MQIEKWSVIIVIALIVVVAGSAYYRTMAQPLPLVRGDQPVGFELIETESGDRFFGVLVSTETGGLRVDVYDSGGVKSGSISLRDATSDRPPVRVLPD